MSKQRGIGRGLAAILAESGDGNGAQELRELPVELIKPNPDQPRSRFDEGSLTALAASIEATGVIQPLLVRPLVDGSYELVAGERRWRAARLAGLSRLPALVRDTEGAAQLETALVENMVREDLNPVDEARACAALVEDLGLSKQEVGRRLGRSRTAVSNLIRLLELPDDALELLLGGELSEGHGRAILQARRNEDRRRLAREAASRGWSVRETERRAKLASRPRPARHARRVDPDLREALSEAEGELEGALGHELRVRVKGDEIRAELAFESIDEIRALARRIRRSGGR